MPKISKIEVFSADIPFKRAFKHSARSREMSESVFVKVSLDNSMAGFGESLPRSYVTGNTRESALKAVKDNAGRLIGASLDDNQSSVELIKNLEGPEAEARCALEIALLDALGKVSSKPVYAILGNVINKSFACSMIISDEPASKTWAICAFARISGYKFIKVKVGVEDDVKKVYICRRVLPKADIRVDANGAWDASRALSTIARLRRFGISCIEQPTPKGNLEAMQEVADFCREPVMADESLCTKEDALKFANTRACDMFNVRLSKCGGIFRSLEIIKIARDNGMGFQIGCMVGETGILSAAGRHIASVADGMSYFEGGYSRFLLKEDAIKEDLTPRRGVGYTLNGSGLGVTVREDVIRRYSKETLVIG
jgi:muconate cycloisomerase